MAALGFRAADAGVGEMLNGGGIASMVRVSGIVCLSSSYAGIFRITGLLDGVKRSIGALARRTTPFAATAVTALVSGMIACNQTLATMLTHQLCAELTESASDCALDLEDTSIVLSALIPWSIAGAVPLSTLGAPVSAMAFAFYLYLLPLWRLAKSAIQRSAG